MQNVGTCCKSELKSELRVSLMRATKHLDPTQIGKLLSLAKGFNCSIQSDLSLGENGFSETGLSSRELDVLLLLANGYTRRDIGNTLGITSNTAATHIANIYRKLEISSVAEATQYAYSQNII